jgi:hypothetical protein
MKKITCTNSNRASSKLFVIFWLCILAALLAWKGSNYSEAVLIRRYLGMTDPSASFLWWFGAGCIAALAIVWSGCVLVKKARARARDRFNGVRYENTLVTLP